MNVLIINKFLHPKGGSETYIRTLGKCLEDHGHGVQYFGMDHPDRVLGNRVGAYTEQMDFHGRANLLYGLKTIYSPEARRKLRLVLEDFQPDVCHLNNFHYQLTPSILLEIRKWQQEKDRCCRIIMTAHDYQLVCPNHMCYDISRGEACEKCLEGNFFSCIRGRCIHGSAVKSAVGALEATIWNRIGIYRHIDAIICCSRFLKERLDRNPGFVGKTVVMHNFVRDSMWKRTEKQEYVLYFGRYTREKGLDLLLDAAKALPHVSFVFAGDGPLAGEIPDLPNIRNMGFLQGETLEKWIREAIFTVYPSRWQENCPLSVLESLALGTPVLAARSGGLPELIQEGVTGELFETGNAGQLEKKLLALWEDRERSARYAENCRQTAAMTRERYYENLMHLYMGKGEP